MAAGPGQVSPMFGRDVALAPEEVQVFISHKTLNTNEGGTGSYTYPTTMRLK